MTKFRSILSEDSLDTNVDEVEVGSEADRRVAAVMCHAQCYWYNTITVITRHCSWEIPEFISGMPGTPWGPLSGWTSGPLQSRGSGMR